ncbi:MAG: hypothetical protein IKO56_06760 [Alphaproteobacteria bacterium]|nr:hypothetical protein [Alphaproteobacteria bacterium]
MDSIEKRNYYAAKSKLLNFYANNRPEKADNVLLNLQVPQYGWQNADIIVNGEVKHTIPISWVYEQPFDNILKWLEQLAEERYEQEVSTYAVFIDAESNTYILGYEPDIDDDEYGIFYVYGSELGDELGVWKDDFVAHAYTKKKTLVKNLYNAISDLAAKLTLDKTYKQEWIESYNKDCQFLARFSSKKVEEYLKKN